MHNGEEFPDLDSKDFSVNALFTQIRDKIGPNTNVTFGRNMPTGLVRGFQGPPKANMGGLLGNTQGRAFDAQQGRNWRITGSGYIRNSNYEMPERIIQAPAGPPQIPGVSGYPMSFNNKKGSFGADINKAFGAVDQLVRKEYNEYQKRTMDLVAKGGKGKAKGGKGKAAAPKPKKKAIKGKGKK